MDLINQESWYIRKKNPVLTDLEEALLDKIEHMEAKIEELEDIIRDQHDDSMGEDL